MRRWTLKSCAAMTLAFMLICGWPDSSQAQNAAPELSVATSLLPPFVIKDGDKLTGFSIDLWEEVAARLKVKTSYKLVADANACIESVRSNNADVGVSGIFYSAERDKLIDYTYPIINTGLQVMVRDSGQGVQLHPLQDWLTLLFSRAAAAWLVAALAIIIIPAHVVWLLDRRNGDGVSPTTKYVPGIFHSLFWAASALTSGAQVMPRQWLARVFAVIWMFSGVVFVALFTAQLTALLTVQQIRGDINGPADLPGKRVGTHINTTSSAYLRRVRADLQEFPTNDEMYQAILEGKVDALVLGAPILAYYATHQGQGRVKMVGPEVERNDMGFVVQTGSTLRKRISTQLLALREDGTYQKIYAKWFGDE